MLAPVSNVKMYWLLKRIIHNEAMKEDPREIYGWRCFFLAASACFGAMSFGWDGSVIGGESTNPIPLFKP